MEQLDPEKTYIQSKVALRCGRGASITSTVGHQYVTATELFSNFHSWFLYVMTSFSQSETCSLFSSIFQVFSCEKTLFLLRKSAWNEATKLAVIIALHFHLTEHPATGTLAAYASDEPIKKLCNKFFLICDKIMTSTLYITSCRM